MYLLLVYDQYSLCLCCLHDVHHMIDSDSHGSDHLAALCLLSVRVFFSDFCVHPLDHAVHRQTVASDSGQVAGTSGVYIIKLCMLQLLHITLPPTNQVTHYFDRINISKSENILKTYCMDMR